MNANNPYERIDQTIVEIRVFLRREVKRLASEIIQSNPGVAEFILHADGAYQFTGTHKLCPQDVQIMDILVKYNHRFNISSEPMKLRRFPNGFVREIQPLRVVDKA